jgi:hypothetical protein
MLQVNNQTPFQRALVVFPNPDGVECAYAVVKATFVIGRGGVDLAAEQLPVVPVDEYWGEPGASSLKWASEATLMKPSTDVLLLGHAYAPDERAKQADVTLKVGPVQKTVRVFGERRWQRGILGAKVSDPEPFEKLPLRYELAFGGTDPRPRDPAKPDFEPRNPVGKGLVPKNSDVPADGLALPNLEDPRQPIRSASDRPPPACFAPVCGHWEPRKSFAGTYDEAWVKKRAPYLPQDFNPRFFQSAPPDLVAPQPLQGGEPVEITGAAPGGPLRFPLPRCSLRVTFRMDGRDQDQPPVLDTVVFEPDAGRLWMVWRACQVVDKHLLRLREVEVRCPEYPRRNGG